MFRKFLTAVLCAVFSLAFTADAQAVFLTSNGDIDAIDPFPAISGPPLINITTLFGGGGNAYTNTIDSDFSGGLSLGDEVRTISFEAQASALNGFNTPLVNPDLSTLIAVGAINGTIVGFSPITGAPIVAFAAGRLFLTSDPLGTFNPNDPSSASGPATAFAEFALTSPQSVVSTPSGVAISFGAGLTQISSPDAVNPLLSEAVLIFREDSTAAQNAGVPGVPEGGIGEAAATLGGDAWLSNVDDVSPPGLFKTDEGVLVIVDQTVESLMLGPGLGLDATDLAALNAYAVAGFGSVFATVFGPGLDGSGFDPFGQEAFTGDFRAQFGSETHIGHQVVPEPSSLMLLGIGAAAMGLVGFRRRRHKKPQAA